MKYFDYFYRQERTLDTPWLDCHWDVFISSWDKSPRVLAVYEHVSAGQKFWLIHPEYKIPLQDLPNTASFQIDGGEAVGMKQLVDMLASQFDMVTTKLCVDITGMLRPHIAVLTSLLKAKGVQQFDAI